MFVSIENAREFPIPKALHDCARIHPYFLHKSEALYGIRFYRQGIPALFRLAPDMNSLVAVGTFAACAYYHKW